MDLRTIRAEIGVALAAFVEACWAVYDYVTESPDLPALLVGVPDLVSYNVNLRGHSRISLPLHVIAGQVDAGATQNRLDAALSRGDATSVVDTLDGAKSPAWIGELRVLSAGNKRAVTVGNATALAVDLDLEVPLA